MVRRLCTIAAGCGLVGAPLTAQPVTRLTTPDAEFAEPFTRIESVRVLGDGRVLVLDGLELSVQLIDFGQEQRPKSWNDRIIG